MEKERLTAFSDGVIAIIITIMVLELKVPHEDNLAALRPLIPVFLSYILSFTAVCGFMGYSYLQKPHSERGREFKVSSICLRTAVYIWEFIGITTTIYFR